MGALRALPRAHAERGPGLRAGQAQGAFRAVSTCGERDQRGSRLMAGLDPRRVVVVGGGISGITSAIEIAETGTEVTLVERSPSLGGRVAGMFRYFPKLCPPYCGLEIQYRRIKANPRISVMTDTEVTAADKCADGWKLSLRRNARKVTDRCTACDECTAACPVERRNPHNQALDATKAIFLPHRLAFPLRYAIDAQACPGASCGKCVPACPFGAIDLSMQPQDLELTASKVIWATGWKPYDAARLAHLGFQRVPNVITNVMFERLAALDGPTGGKLLRPSDGKEAKRVVFVQCAGSRDDEHLPYCSAVCCQASLKQASFVRETYPDSRVEIFYTDRRAGDNEDFLRKVQSDPNIVFTKGKVGQVTEEPGSGDITVVAQDTPTGPSRTAIADLVVLATGIVPETSLAAIPSGITRDAYGFLTGSHTEGFEVVGCASRPSDVTRSVQDATGAGIRAQRSLAVR
ncbi:MAG: CoB--CoM heterodisulfide reductase iron-sulfur subunit A family protein [Deltaproteobacteria bacterium]|nr:CoB--CoM heterodisulfide reductase iron-sulfur subunit A family protein [Deltaproteobacteria bacterium]